MPNIDDVVDQARAEAAAELRTRLRARLLTLPHEWVVEQLIDEVLDRLGFPLPASIVAEPVTSIVASHQLQPVDLDEELLTAFINRYQNLDRPALETDGFLLDSPAKGGPLIRTDQRSAAGESLLAEAKNVLYALLFGTETDGVGLQRVQRELLTLTVPMAKVAVFDFIREATLTGSTGSTDDDQAANTLLRIEYGEAANELIGNGIVTALRLINNLEVNEQILYARIEHVEGTLS